MVQRLHNIETKYVQHSRKGMTLGSLIEEIDTAMDLIITFI